MGDMRGYFHRLGYWGFIIRLILLRFSFVFYINFPIRKLLTTVIQVGGLTHHFLGKCLYQVGNMIVVF